MQPTRTRDPDNHRAAATVFVVDDDDAMRRSLEFLIASAGYAVRAFASAQAFLDYYQPIMRGCLLLDVRMPGMSGLDALERLRASGTTIPVIFVTAFGNIPMAVRAVKGGAFDFIEKPFEGTALLARIRAAMALETRGRDDQPDLPGIRQHLASLTAREREVMDRVVGGALNKQTAAEFDISIKTVENHRAKVMEKMQAQSLADLVRMAIAVDSGSR